MNISKLKNWNCKKIKIFCKVGKQKLRFSQVFIFFRWLVCLVHMKSARKESRKKKKKENHVYVAYAWKMHTQSQENVLD